MRIMKYLLTIILFFTPNIVSGLDFIKKSLVKEGGSRCFQLSWLGPIENGKINCSSEEYKTTPCFEPIYGLEPPNFEKIWEAEVQGSSKFTCLLRPGYSCLKYTTTFNGAMVTSSHFCGKMIENAVNIIENQCYSQKVEGHVIETCACQSTADQMPCNLGTMSTPLEIMILVLISITYIIS